MSVLFDVMSERRCRRLDYRNRPGAAAGYRPAGGAVGSPGIARFDEPRAGAASPVRRPVGCAAHEGFFVQPRGF